MRSPTLIYTLAVGGGAFWLLLIYWRLKGDRSESVGAFFGELFLLGLVCPLLICFVGAGVYSIRFPLPDGSRWQNIPLAVLSGLYLTLFGTFYHEISDRARNRKPRAYELYREYEAQKLRTEAARRHKISIASEDYDFGVGSLIRVSSNRLIAVIDQLVNYVNNDHVKRSKELIEWVNLIFGISLFSLLAWAIGALRTWVSW